MIVISADGTFSKSDNAETTTTIAKPKIGGKLALFNPRT
jgi:hypothetical protein